MSPPTEQLIRDYLNRLSVAARGRLSSEDRRALVTRTHDFIERNASRSGPATAMEVAALLSRLGDPGALVDQEVARLAAERGEPVPPEADQATGLGARLRRRTANASWHWPVTPAHPELVTELLNGNAGNGAQPPPAQPASPAVVVPRQAGPADSGAADSPSPPPDGQPDPAAPARPVWPASAAQTGALAAVSDGDSAAAGDEPGGDAPGASHPREAAPGEAASAGSRADPSPAGQVPAAKSAPDRAPATVAGAPAAEVPAAKGPDSKATDSKAAGSKATDSKAADSKAADTKAASSADPAAAPAAGPAGGTGPAADPHPTEPVVTHWVNDAQERTRSAPVRTWVRDRASRARALSRRHPLESAALVLLGLGGVVFPPVWLVGVGVALASKVWDYRDKWAGIAGPIVLLIIGTSLGVALGSSHHQLGGYLHEVWIYLNVLSRLCAVAGTWYLYWRLTHSRPVPDVPPWNRPRRVD